MYTVKRMGIAFVMLFVMTVFTAEVMAKPAPTLKEGSKSTAVKTIQKQLIELGYLDENTKITGYYGDATTEAVKSFQTLNRFEVTGTLPEDQQKYLLSGLPLSADDAKDLQEAQERFNQSITQIMMAGTTSAGTASVPGDSKVETMIQYGLQLLGKPYKYGGRGPDSFDCSGFVRYVLLAVDVKAPGSAQTQADNDAWRKISDPGELRRGDLVFFHTSGRSVTIGHSGIYLGNNEFLHSEPTGGGVIISKIFDTYSDGSPSYYNKNYHFARRMFE